MKQISIIMPAYNSSETIEDSINSVINQSYKDWELIVVDDCSIDGTGDIVNKIIERNKDLKIKLYKNTENKGVAYSRNFGVKVAEGDLIAFLDSDDLWTEDKLEKQIKLYRKLVENSDSNSETKVLLFTGSAFITEKNKRLDYTLHVPVKVERKDILKQNVISCSSVLAGKELLTKHEFPITNMPIHEDFAVWIEILKEIPFAYGIDEPLLLYRVSDSSKSSKKSKAAVMNWNTYRYVKMGFFESVYYMMFYAVRGFMKWRKIKSEGSKQI